MNCWQVSALGDRASASEAAADRAEEDASVAMRSAETGVREEMEAAAVVKETESALSKALAELTFLETSYEEKDFESKAEKAKAKEKAQKEAEIAVRDALAAVNKTVQSPEAEGGLGKQTIHLPAVFFFRTQQLVIRQQRSRWKLSRRVQMVQSDNSVCCFAAPVLRLL